MKYIHLVSVFFLSIASCTEQNNPVPRSSSLKSTLTKGYTIPKDSIRITKKTPAGKPFTVKAGKPKVSKVDQNTILAGEPRIISARNPILKTPGTDTFLLPKVIPTKGIIIKAGLPEVVLAKDATAKDINPGNFLFYTSRQGLKANVIKCQMQDKAGNLWFGTSGGGVCRYDGKFFTSFTEKQGLCNNFVFSIVEDKKGNLWFGTDGGISCYDGRSFTNFTEKEGLCSNTVWKIFEDTQGNIWVATQDGGVSRYDGACFTNLTKKQGLTCNGVVEIFEDKNGDIWFGTDEGACRYDGRSFADFKWKEGLSDNVVWSIVEDKKGDLWFATNGDGVFCYNGKTFANLDEEQGLPYRGVVGILADQRGELWFNTYNRGVCLYDGTYLTHFTEKEGLSNDNVSSMFEDKSGTIWFGTDNGVCFHNGNAFTNFTRTQGLSSNVVTSILENRDGILWFTTEHEGVCRYDGASFTNFTSKEGLGGDLINASLEDRHGNIWFALFLDGVSVYNGTSFTGFGEKDGLYNYVNSILEDKKGNIWFGTYGGGVYKYDGTSFTNFAQVGGLSKYVISSILEDKQGNIWFASEGAGLFRYDGGSFSNFTVKEGLCSNVIYAILADKNQRIWVGTHNGLGYYDGKALVNFTEKEGLLNNTVKSILQDREGNLWFGTSRGLSKITSAKLESLAKNDISNLSAKETFFYNINYNDGFSGFSCKQNSVLQDSKGRIWWGANTLACYDPKKADKTDTSAPTVNITSIKLFGEEIYWPGLKSVSTNKDKANDTVLANGISLKDMRFEGITKWYNLPEQLSLPYNNNNLTFNFIGVHIQGRSHIKYQYMLKGMDPDWSSVTDRTEAPYGNLPNGDYTFKVKAMNQSGVWSKEVEYKFTVRPPWWQTWWFRSLVALVIIGSAYAFYRWRTASLIRDKKLLEKTVQERTAEVVEQKQVIEEKHKEISDSINYAERIQRALLASQKLLDQNLPDYFILFKPKDVVSGDFYWASKLANGNFILVTADSTGHGVPGAIMSIVNIASLKEAVQKVSRPDLILNETRKLVIENLKHDGSPEGGKDGMDGSILSFDFENNILQAASAQNPIWIIRNNELIEIKGDRFPIGKNDKDQEPFTLHTFPLQKQDFVYTLTDGYSDQFGGPKRKKFRHKQLQEYLLSIASHPLSVQKQMLAETFDQWKAGLEQVDDVCIIGVKI